METLLVFDWDMQEVKGFLEQYGVGSLWFIAIRHFKYLVS